MVVKISWVCDYQWNLEGGCLDSCCLAVLRRGQLHVSRMLLVHRLTAPRLAGTLAGPDSAKMSLAVAFPVPEASSPSKRLADPLALALSWQCPSHPQQPARAQPAAETCVPGDCCIHSDCICVL